jgi:ParB/RepB/Spo0J family partition protein
MGLLIEQPTKEKYPNSLMSPAAIKNDENCGLELFKVSDIYSDHQFNCRMQEVTPMDVIDLAKSIAEKGLLQPLILRPCGELETDPANYKYVLVAGYRRIQAYRVNNHPVVPCILRADQGKDSYRALNLIENLKRKNLNMMEEANGVAHYYNAGWSRDAIAETIGVSPGWVQIRCMVLELEPEVQQEIAAGILTTTHVRKLYSIKDREQQLAVALQIKKVRQKGDISTTTVEKILEKDKKPKATSKKRRTTKEIEDMMEILHNTFGKYGLTGRALAWAAGHIANYEFHQDIHEEAQEQGISYSIPDFEL